MPIIFHIDMDMFYVACELLRRPELKGKPVVVGADPQGGRGRGVVATCSYEARAFGVRSGMPISMAYKLCPGCAFLPVDFSLYVPMSQKVMAIVRRFATRVQQVSIDEAFFVADVIDYTTAEQFATALQTALQSELHLSSSIGIGPNKSIAKIASDFKKPHGLTIVRPEQAAAFLHPLPARKLHGVGPKTEAALESLGLHTIGDIAHASDQQLNLFGKMGAYLHALACGKGDVNIREEQELKSMGREMTFEHDTNNSQAVLDAAEDLCRDVHAMAASYRAAYRTVTVKVRYQGFETHTRQKTLAYPSADVQVLIQESRSLLLPFLTGKKIRLIGVKVARFSADQQPPLSRFTKQNV